MSVRVFSQENLYAELKKAGFEPTAEKTEKFTIWRRSDGEVLSVNHSHATYPYYYLNGLLGVYGINYNFSGSKTVIDLKSYKITPDKPSDEKIAIE